MSRKRYSEHTRFLVLRACWTILRGGAVAFRINFTQDGWEAISSPTFLLDCQVNGKPMTPWDFEHADPEPNVP